MCVCTCMQGLVRECRKGVSAGKRELKGGANEFLTYEKELRLLEGARRLTLLRAAARHPGASHCGALCTPRQWPAPQVPPVLPPHAGCACAAVHCRAVFIASTSFVFQWRATFSSSGSSGLGALISAWMLRAGTGREGRGEGGERREPTGWEA